MYGKKCILVEEDYVSKLVEAIPTRTNSHREVLRFATRYIFPWYGYQRAIISDGGSRFNNAHFRALFKKYKVHHRITIPYHPHVNGQVEVSNIGQEHVEENYLTRWEGLGAQASWCTMGVPDGLQDTHRDVSFLVYLRESVPSSSWAWASSILSYQTTQLISRRSREIITFPVSRVTRAKAWRVQEPKDLQREDQGFSWLTHQKKNFSSQW